MKGGSGSKTFAVKTAIGREKEAAEMVNGQNDYRDLSLEAIVVSPETRGYIYVEADDVAEVLRATENVRLARKVLETPASPEDVERVLNPRPAVKKISYGDTVKVTGGEFESLRGRVENISHSEEKATVEIDAGVVPFSATVGVDDLKHVAD